MIVPIIVFLALQRFFVRGPDRGRRQGLTAARSHRRPGSHPLPGRRAPSDLPPTPGRLLLPPATRRSGLDRVVLPRWPTALVPEPTDRSAEVGLRAGRPPPGAACRAGPAATRARLLPVRRTLPGAYPGSSAARRSTAPAWTTSCAVARSTVDGRAHAPRSLPPTAAGGPAGSPSSSSSSRWSAASLRGRWTLTNTGPRRTSSDGLEVVLPVADHLTELLDFTGRHERERTPAAPAGHRRALAARGPRRPTGPRRRHHGACCRHAGLRLPTTGEVLGVHVAWSGNRVLRVERDAATGYAGRRRRAAAARARWRSRRARATRPRGSASRGRRRARRPRGAWHTWQRALPAHPDAAAGRRSTPGRRCTSTTTSTGCRASPTARPGSAWSGSCSTTGGSAAGATTPPGSATGGSTRSVWPDGLSPLDRPRPRRSAWSSGCGSSRRWSTPTPTCAGAHPDWILAAGPPAAAERGSSRCST